MLLLKRQLSSWAVKLVALAAIVLFNSGCAEMGDAKPELPKGARFCATDKHGRKVAVCFDKDADDKTFDAVIDEIDASHIRSISIKASNFSETSINGLVNFPALKGLSISYCDVSLSHLPKLPKLTSLNVRKQPALGTDEAKAISRNKSLINLHITTQSFEKGAAEEIAKLPKLQILDLADCSLLKTSDFKALSRLPKLTELDLAHVGITDTGVVELCGMKSLETLNLGSTKITDKSLSRLAGMPNLTKLWLHQCKISDAGVKELWTGGFKNLALPALPSLTADCLDGIDQASTLEGIALGGDWVTVAALERIATLPNIKNISFSGSSSVSEADVNAVRHTYPHVRIVTKID